MSSDIVIDAGTPTEDPSDGGPEAHGGGHKADPDGGGKHGPASTGGQERASRAARQDGAYGSRSTEGRRWTLADRGSFVVGTCGGCGYTSPARRARFTAESDMLAHELLCDDGS